MVIIIILGSDNHSPDDALEIEVWELGLNPGRRKTRSTPAIIPSATNKIQFDGASNVNPAGASLTVYCPFRQCPPIRH